MNGGKSPFGLSSLPSLFVFFVALLNVGTWYGTAVRIRTGGAAQEEVCVNTENITFIIVLLKP